MALPACKHCAVFLAGLLNEADNSVDGCLIDDILDGSFSPVKGEKGHSLDDLVILGTMLEQLMIWADDLIEAQPLDNYIVSNEYAVCHLRWY
jgi:hypothetical protein